MPLNLDNLHNTYNPHSSNDALMSSLQQSEAAGVFKVAILGAESTGKTTLCQDLACHFNTQWVPEFMRPYLQRKWDEERKTCEWEDLLPIACGQMALENHRAKSANHTLFCDTCLFELMVYAYIYYDACPKPIETAALSHDYDMILLTEVDVPWVADDLRDAPNRRHEISDTFAKALNKQGKTFHRIGGDRQTRVNQVAQWIKDMDA